MREIKFRFYDNVNKRFWFGGDEGKSVGEETFQTYFVNGVFTATMFEPISYGFQDVDDYLERELPNSQFTGLKDKNGKEVFEGDIVIAWSQGQKEICKVKWGQGRVGFFLYRSPNIIWHLSGGGFDYTFEMIEIIGNIYENTELVGENNG